MDILTASIIWETKINVSSVSRKSTVSLDSRLTKIKVEKLKFSLVQGTPLVISEKISVSREAIFKL